MTPLRVPLGPRTCGWCFRPATCTVELRPFWRVALGVPTRQVPACAYCAAERLARRR